MIINDDEDDTKDKTDMSETYVQDQHSEIAKLGKPSQTDTSTETPLTSSQKGNLKSQFTNIQLLYFYRYWYIMLVIRLC